MDLRIGVVAGLASVVLLGCGAPSVRGDGGPPDGGASDGGTSDGGASGCTTALEDIRCTWRCCEQTLLATASPDCSAQPSYLTFYRCAATTGRTIVTFSWGTHEKECHYSASGDLEGALLSDDVTTFCAHSSRTLGGGAVESCDSSNQLMGQCLEGTYLASDGGL